VANSNELKHSKKEEKKEAVSVKKVTEPEKRLPSLGGFGQVR